MPEGCRKLFNAEACGIAVTEEGGTLCKFHQIVEDSKPITPEILDEVLDYVRRTQHSKIDFWGLTFQNFSFSGQFSQLIRENPKPIYFNFSKFVECRFWGVSFQLDTFFNKCEIERTSFWKVTFNGDVTSFKGAVLDKDTTFDHCDFNCSDIVNFSDTLLESARNPLLFCYIKSHEVIFDGASVFAKRFYIKISPFEEPEKKRHWCVIIRSLSKKDETGKKDKAGKIDFTGMKVDGHFELSCIPDKDDEFEGVVPELDFSYVNFSQMKTATFVGINLSKAIFNYAVLGSASFVSVTWAKANNDIWNKLYQAELPDGIRGPREMVRQYVQLKNNFESAGDKIGAGDWHLGEMKAREEELQEEKKNDLSKWMKFRLWVVIKLHCAYKAISNYGENDIRALGWVGGVLFVFAFIHFLNGFELAGEPINYNLFWPCSVDLSAIKVWFLDSTKAVAYSLGQMSFISGIPISADNTVTAVLNIIQKLMAIILVPMYLLALRRKFKR